MLEDEEVEFSCKKPVYESKEGGIVRCWSESIELCIDDQPFLVVVWFDPFPSPTPVRKCLFSSVFLCVAGKVSYGLYIDLILKRYFSTSSFQALLKL